MSESNAELRKTIASLQFNLNNHAYGRRYYLDPDAVEMVCEALLSRLGDAKPAGREVDFLTALQRLPELVARDVAEMPDRSSHEDFPEALVVTSRELMDIVAHRIELLREALTTPTETPKKHVDDPGPVVTAADAAELARRKHAADQGMLPEYMESRTETPKDKP